MYIYSLCFHKYFCSINASQFPMQTCLLTMCSKGLFEEMQRKSSEEPSLNAQIVERSYVCQGPGKKITSEL